MQMAGVRVRELKRGSFWMREIESKRFLKIESLTKAWMIMSTENGKENNLIVLLLLQRNFNIFA